MPLRRAPPTAPRPDDAAKKELRTVLTRGEFLLMCLMPLSQFAACGLTYAAATGLVDVMRASCAIGSFYVLWAVHNKRSGNVNEKGHFTAGALAIGGGMGSHIFAALGAASVVGSIALVLVKVGPWPRAKMAYVMKRTYGWTGVFKAYMLSMMLQMFVLGGLIVRDYSVVLAQRAASAGRAL